MIRLYLIFIFISFNLLANSNKQKLDQIKQLNHFVLGSCNREYMDQPLWKDIIADNPQLFIWGGDNIYGDKEPYKDNLEMKYQIQNSHPEYTQLKNKTPIIGLWDDHDYGANNGGKVPNKYKNRDLFFQFMEEPIDSPRRKHEGIYTSYEFGTGDKTVKFILLDNRFNQTEDDLLGEKQWQWLENELKNSQAKIHFIQSGIPISSVPIIKSEEWIDHPESQKRLYDLIEKFKTPGVIFLSGDKHFSAFWENDSYVEFMSSGLTHKSRKIFRPYLRAKFPQAYFDLNYMFISILWDQNPLKVKAEIRSKGKTHLSRTYKLNGIRFQKSEE